VQPYDSDDWPEYLTKLDRFLSGEEQTTLFKEMEKLQCSPRIDHTTMSAPEIARALTDLVWSLWDLHFVVDDADHLTDRELYVALLEYCAEPTMVFPGIEGATCHWSPIGSYATDEDIRISLQYYSDAEERARHVVHFGEPPGGMPPMELPPLYRSWLPQRDGLRS
jgi:hypothetical protein